MINCAADTTKNTSPVISIGTNYLILVINDLYRKLYLTAIYLPIANKLVVSNELIIENNVRLAKILIMEPSSTGSLSVSANVNVTLIELVNEVKTGFFIYPLKTSGIF